MALLTPIQMLPTKQTSIEEWIEWHKLLKKRYGKKIANAYWVKGWRRFGSSDKNTNDLRTYMAQNGVLLDKDFLSSIVDKGSDIADFAGDIFQVGKYTGIAIVVGSVAVVLFAAFNLAKKPAESIGVAARAFATKGA